MIVTPEGLTANSMEPWRDEGMPIRICPVPLKIKNGIQQGRVISKKSFRSSILVCRVYVKELSETSTKTGAGYQFFRCSKPIPVLLSEVTNLTY
jgi:hypothetical protein